MTLSTMEPAQPWQERFHCPSCSKSFVRKAHMLRHQQQHVSQRPFPCAFCSKCFKRSDVLRAHQFRCKERGDAPVPEGQSKGRKRSSCVSCVKLRTKCDLETPCTRCQELGKDCIRSSSPHKSRDTRPKSRDAIPILHLLNAPESDDFAPRFPIRNESSGPGEEDDDPSMGDAEDSEDASRWSEDYEQSETCASAPAPDFDGMTFDSFFGGFESMAFGNYPLQQDLAQITSGPGIVSATSLALEPRAFEIRQLLQHALRKHAIDYPDNPQLPLLTADIELLTHVEIDSCLTSYINNYYRHCPIIHRPSFDPTVAPIALVLSCVALGAMYSDPFKGWMKGLLDIIETYIFTLPEVRDEFLGTMEVLGQPDEAAVNYHFQTFQGAYLCVVVQYFSGNLAARRRARRHRFATIINIARYFGLLTAQHASNVAILDELAFHSWVQTESRIRTMNVILALDAAMGVFNNCPPRINYCELDLQLPAHCEYFALSSQAEMAQHVAFPPSRMHLVEAFQRLFVHPNDLKKAFHAENLCCWDMQYLVHVLYTHCWQQLFGNPLHRIPSTSSSLESQHVYEPMKYALTNWKTLWDDIRASMSRSAINEMGFETSADSYWTLVRMIVYKSEMKRAAAVTSASPEDTQMLDHSGINPRNGSITNGQPHLSGRGPIGLIPTLDFTPLPADSDNQGAHLRKILQG